MGGDELPFPVDADGFLSAGWLLPTWPVEALSAGMLVTPEVAARGGPLVLLGEPGVGKTTVFAGLAAGLAAIEDVPDGAPALLWVDGGQLTDVSFAELLGARLAALPGHGVVTGVSAAVPDAASAQGAGPAVALTVVLDQLDESTMLPRVGGALSRALTGRDTSQVRLLLGCRTADYPSTLTEELRRLFGRCVLADLAPLTLAQAEELASSAGVDGVALVEAAVARGAGALASVPLTLELLVRVYREHGHLEGSPRDLFARGVRLLVAEPDESRWQDAEVPGSSDQRLVVAGRVAAGLLLSGRRTSSSPTGSPPTPTPSTPH